MGGTADPGAQLHAVAEVAERPAVGVDGKRATAGGVGGHSELGEKENIVNHAHEGNQKHAECRSEKRTWPV